MNEQRTKTAQDLKAETRLLKAFEQHRSALKRFIARYLNNQHDIEDVAQESFLRAFRAGLNYDVQQPKSFLFRIAKNVAISQLRLKSRQITEALDEQNHPDALNSEWTLEDDLMARERLAMQCDAVAALAPQCRRVYILRKVHGMSHKDIAQRLNIHIKTVEKHLYKGIAACDRHVRDAQAVQAEQSGRPLSTTTKEGQAHG